MCTGFSWSLQCVSQTLNKNVNVSRVALVQYPFPFSPQHALGQRLILFAEPAPKRLALIEYTLSSCFLSSDRLPTFLSPQSHLRVSHLWLSSPCCFWNCVPNFRDALASLVLCWQFGQLAWKYAREASTCISEKSGLSFSNGYDRCQRFQQRSCRSLACPHF